MSCMSLPRTLRFEKMNFDFFDLLIGKNGKTCAQKGLEFSVYVPNRVFRLICLRKNQEYIDGIRKVKKCLKR